MRELGKNEEKIIKTKTREFFLDNNLTLSKITFSTNKRSEELLIGSLKSRKNTLLFKVLPSKIKRSYKMEVRVTYDIYDRMRVSSVAEGEIELDIPKVIKKIIYRKSLLTYNHATEILFEEGIIEGDKEEYKKVAKILLTLFRKRFKIITDKVSILFERKSKNKIKYIVTEIAVKCKSLNELMSYLKSEYMTFTSYKRNKNKI